MRNIFKLSCLAVLIFFNVICVSSFAAESDFKINNPDGHKYEFARSYISALSSFYSIEQRWAKNSPKKKFKGDDMKTIRGTLEYLVQDNLDLRVTKSYMVKYLTVPNPLMRKVADMMILACENDISLNNKAKFLWQDWLNLRASSEVKSDQEKLFIKAQREIELKRKSNDQTLVQASILMTKVLLSQENPNDKGHLLAITDKERNKLLSYLDVYGKSVLDWGLKPGQSTLKASIAVIREVLEDSIFIARK